MIELIEFTYPKDTKICLPNILWRRSEEDLVEFLTSKFKVFGLIHSLVVRPKDDETYYSYITFYSAQSARKAKLKSHNNLLISGMVCRVVKSHQSNSYEQTLSKAKCVDLANYYLGFNGWNSEIVYHRMEDISEETPVKVKYGSAIRLTVGHVTVDGVGVAESNDNVSKAKLISYVGKCALNAAFRNAFSKLILVVVDQSKVRVQLNTEIKDPFYYNPLWDKPPVVTVNNLTSDDSLF